MQIRGIFQGNQVVNHRNSCLGFKAGWRMWLSSGLKEIDVTLLASSLQKCRINAKFVFKLPLTHTSAIPHFKEVIVMATNCDACGERTNEVKSGGKLSLR